MTLTQADVQNKESRENKFLSERIIQKALDCGEIDSASVGKITELFQAAFSQHKGDPARARVEALMSTLRDYIANKEKKQIGGVIDELQKPQDETVSKIIKTDKNNSRDDQVVQADEVDDENIYEEEQELLQKIINEKIINADLSEKLREEASQIVLDETRHIIGTSVSERVFELSVTNALEIFKQKYKLAEKEKKEEIEKAKRDKESADTKSLPAGRQGSGVAKEEEKHKEAKKSKETKDTSNAVTQDSAQDSTPTQPLQRNEEDKNKTTKKKKLSLTEATLQKAREDDINNPLKPHTLHWPTSTISFGTPVRKTKLTDKESSSAKDQDNASRSTEIEQVNIQEQEVNSETAEPEILGKEQNIPQETQSKTQSGGKQTPRDLSSASNTKMVFDADLELNSSSIEAKHSLSKQNKELFDKYINEQINGIMETVTQSNALPDDMLKGIRDDLNKHAVDISKDTGISIKERIQRLDALFQEQKREYTIKKIDNDFNPKEFIDAIIKRSEKEINTGDQEADARFRKTLRNTLSFKARHLVGSDMDPDLVSKALNKEYAKHRSFYTKNM